MTVGQPRTHPMISILDGPNPETDLVKVWGDPADTVEPLKMKGALPRELQKAPAYCQPSLF